MAVGGGGAGGGWAGGVGGGGGARVGGVDVGYGQLAWSLRTDERVVCMERTNVRYLTQEQIPDALDFGSVDVSFISLKLILPALRGLMKDEGQVVCLVKPQFEAGKDQIGKKGVVRDPKVHQAVLENFLDHATESGFFVQDLTYSPVRGPEGNIEYLAHLSVQPLPPYDGDLAALVQESHESLGGKSG